MLQTGNGKEGITMITIFFVTVAANVASYYIIKWLDKK